MTANVRASHFWALLCTTLVVVSLFTGMQDVLSSILFGKAEKKGLLKQDNVGNGTAVPFVMSNYDTIFLFHTRKAGGSSLRRWLEKVTEKHNLTFVVEEGLVLNHENAEKILGNERTIYITSLRNPIDRIISAYWFEGRWPQKMHVKNRTKDNALDFMEWAQQAETLETTKRKAKPNFMWSCISECYCKWFGGFGTIPNLTLALDRLHQIDVVILTDNLGNKEYVESLSKRLDAEEIPFPHANSGKKTRPSNSTYELSAADIEYLTERNQKDLQLMKFIFENQATS